MSKIIDLETGKTSVSEEKPQTKTTTAKRTTVKEKVERGIESRLDAVFTRIADTLQNRGDDELGTAIREDKKALAGGLLALTGNFPFLRNPLVVVLNVTEFFLAFGRVGGILIRRAVERRQRSMEAREAAQAEWEANQNPAYAAQTVPIA